MRGVNGDDDTRDMTTGYATSGATASYPQTVDFEQVTFEVEAASDRGVSEFVVQIHPDAARLRPGLRALYIAIDYLA